MTTGIQLYDRIENILLSAQRPMSVSEIEKRIKGSRKEVRNHLKALLKKGKVKTTGGKKWLHFSLPTPKSQRQRVLDAVASYHRTSLSIAKKTGLRPHLVRSYLDKLLHAGDIVKDDVCGYRVADDPELLPPVKSKVTPPEPEPKIAKPTYPTIPVDATQNEIKDLCRQRFWDKVTINGLDECWLWRGAKDTKGYGHYHVSGALHNRSAPRVAYWLTFDDLPSIQNQERRVVHLCDTALCVNPFHLKCVDKKVAWKYQKSLPRENALKTHCKYGHEFTPENTINLPDGGRKCRKCSKDNALRYREEHKRQFNKMKITPTKEQLKEDLKKNLTWAAIGAQYGMTGNGVRYWARKYGLLPPKR